MEVTGLSVSQCISAIALGKIPVRCVKKIIGDTACLDFTEIWDNYSKTCWKDHAWKAKEVFFQLAIEDKIDQPRLRKEKPPETGEGIWKVGDAIMTTEALSEMIEISDHFLQFSLEERDRFFDFLPKVACDRLVKEITDSTFRKMFPGMSTLAKTLPADQLYQMIKDRLKQFYRNAQDIEKMAIHPFVIKLLGPFLRRKMSQLKDSGTGPRGNAKNPKLSRYMKSLGS